MRCVRTIVSAVAVVLGWAGAAAGQTYSNTAPITIPTLGAATPYPSVIVTSGAPTSIDYVTVTLNGLNHTFPGDIQVVLVAPGGERFMLMSGVGGNSDVSGINVTFAPDAATVAPSASPLTPGVYRPSNNAPFSLPSPCPPAPYSTDLTALNGLNANGTWSLFVNDRVSSDSGLIAGGWSISFNGTQRQPALPSTAFTYQGRLEGVAPDATVFMRFGLWDHPTSTNLNNLTSLVLTRTVELRDGVFSVPLDFGSAALRPRALYVQVAVSTVSPAGPYVTLSPRQLMSGTPLALQLRGLTVDASDRVGVGGVDDPAFALEAGGQIRVRGFGSSGTTAAGVWLSSPNGSGGQTNRGFVGLRDDSNIGLFGTSWGLLLNTASNNVAIGESFGQLPAERLTVTGNVQINTGTGVGRLNFGPVGNFAANAENSDAMFFQRANPVSNTSVLRLNLGDDSSAASTDAFLVTTSADGTNFTDRFRFGADGNAFKPGGGSWSVLSDASTKEGIAPLSGTLEKLLGLHGYSFTYKPEFVAEGRALEGRQVGLLAQEVEKVFPEWVGRGADGKLFVTERATTALMVEALRDLRAEKDAVAAKAEAAQREAEAVREENRALLRRLEALERRLEGRGG